MKLKSKFDEHIEKSLNAKFQKIVKRGLLARDVVPIKLEDETRARLALLCVCENTVYAVVCVGKKPISLFELLGNFIQAQEGVILKQKSNWIELYGSYAGLKAPLVVAKDVSIKR